MEEERFTEGELLVLETMLRLVAVLCKCNHEYYSDELVYNNTLYSLVCKLDLEEYYDKWC